MRRNSITGWIVGLIALILLTACSQNEGTESKPKEEKASTEQFTAADDLEGMLKEGPGKYAGDRYDQKKVQQELDKLDEGLTAEKAYNHLIYLLAADYESVVEKIDAFDTSYQLTDKPGQKETNKQQATKEEPQLNVEILLDASGSMAEGIQGKEKMDLAKQAITRFVSKLPEEANIALRVYGHKGSNSQADKAESCASTEMVYPFSSYQSGEFQKSLDKFQPTGWTPLAKSIEEANKDLEQLAGEKVKNIVYIVSDGIETCDGDPVKAAKELNESDIAAEINIIGFDVDDAGQQALKKVAEAGGGNYATVNTQQELEDEFQKEKRQLEEEWNKWWISNWKSTGEEWKEKQELLIELLGIPNGKIINLRIQEFDQMREARVYLVKNGKLKEGEEEALEQRLNKRNEMIEEYSSNKLEELGDKIGDEQEKARDEISDETKKNQ